MARSNTQASQYGAVNSNGYRVLGEGATEDLTRISADYQKKETISPLRRTFCLLLLFDLIVTVIIWILFTAVKSTKSMMTEIQKQVENYSFKTSLFDTVVLSLFRFLFLVLAYALLRSNRPWFVAISTAITCSVMLAKAVEYQYDKGPDVSSGLEILDYLIIITPVVLSWVETWLIDLKVLPHEKKERDRAAAGGLMHPNLAETSPLLHRFLRSNQARTVTEESYYSPAASESEEGASDSEDARSYQSTASQHRPAQSDSTQLDIYRNKILDAQSKALEILESDGWTKETGKNEVDGIVFSKTTQSYGKVFKLIAEIDVDALTLFHDLVDNASSMPKWNPTILEVRTLEQVDDSTDISYNIAAEGAGGMVSSRDFVYLRHWEQSDGWYITSSVSTEYPAMPQERKYVRGEQGPSVIRMKDLTRNKLRLEWLLNTNLKGWLSQFIIDQALSGVLMTYLDNLRTHAASLQH